MSLKRINRKLGRVTKRKVGDLDIMERNPPVGFNRIDIYADTETWYKTWGIKPWEHIGKKGCSAVLSEMTVFPCLISWQYRRRQFRKDYKSTYESGGWVKDTKLIQFIDDFEAFMFELSFVYNDWKMTPTLYFHNSSYDIPVLEPLMRELDPDLILYFYVKPTNKGFIRGAFESPKYNFYCEFGDTLQYNTTLSIDKAGEILGKPKIKGIPYGLCNLAVRGDVMEYDDLHTGEVKTFSLEKYKAYIERDVTIMREINERKIREINQSNSIMIEDWDHMKQEQFNQRCMTLSSHSKRICDMFLKRNGWESVDTTFRFNLKDSVIGNFKELYQWTVESNCGGFTTFNEEIRKYECPADKHIKYFDMNSMYPTIMTGKLPYGEIFTEIPEGDYVTWYCIEITDLKWRAPLDILHDQGFGVTKRNQVPFFCLKEYFDFIVANADIEYVLRGTYYQRRAKILEPLINKYYETRKELKKTLKTMENNGEKITAKYEDLDNKQNSLKLLMNSLYGKMCEQGHLIGCVFNEGEYRKYESDREYYPCILTGSYITYMGRLNLLNKIKLVIEAGYDFLYADTDSVVLGCPKDADLTPIFGVDRGNLGEWKDEGTYHIYLNIGLKKKYVLFDLVKRKWKPALSGIPRSVRHLIEERLETDFERVIEDMKILFNPDNNVVIKNCKVTHVLSQIGSQQILYNTDFQMNSDLGKKTHRMILETDDYRIEKWEGK